MAAFSALLLAAHAGHAEEPLPPGRGPVGETTSAGAAASADATTSAGATAKVGTAEATAVAEADTPVQAGANAEGDGTTASTTASPALPQGTISGITLKVTLGDSTLGADAIEQAIETELRTTLDRVDEPADLELTLGGGRVVARARGSNGRVIERSMALPPTEEEQLQVIALLSENLLRDEASAVLSELPEEPAPAPAAASTPTATDEPAEAPKKAPEEEPAPFWPVGVSFTRTLGIPSKKADVAFALAVPDGQWHALKGLGISAVSLSWVGRSTGLAIAGVFHESASFDGLSIAGVYDAANDANGSRRGLSIAGLYSRGVGDVMGLQIGGLMSSAGKTFSGLQIGGLMTEATERLMGLQIATFNHAGVATHGMQIGVVNIAQQGGAQIGVVNVRTKGDGPQIGLIGIGPETRMQLVSWVQGFNLGELEGGMPTGPTANFGLRIQTKYVTSSAHLGLGVETLGCGPQNDCGTGATLLIPGYTIGGRLPVSKVWSFELDLQHRIVGAGSIYHPNFLALRGSVVARVHPLLAFFVAAGPELVFPTVSDNWVREHVALGVQVL